MAGATTANGTGFVTAKPAISGSDKTQKWFRDPGNGEQGTPLPADYMNDDLGNERKLYERAGIDPATYARGDTNVRSDAILALTGEFVLPASAAYTSRNNGDGPMPLIRKYVTDRYKFVPVTETGVSDFDTIRGDILLDVVSANTSRAVNDTVLGKRVGIFECDLRTVSSTGVASNYTVTSADVGSSVYLVRANINEPSLTNVYSDQASWNANANGSSSGTAYYNGSEGSIYANHTEVGGDFPSDRSGTWRLRQANGASVTGNMSVVVNDNAGRIVFRIGDLGQMQTAFGNSNIISGGQWILEKVTTTVVTSNAKKHTYALWNEVHFNHQFSARYVGIVTRQRTGTSAVEVAFNLNVDPENRPRMKDLIVPQDRRTSNTIINLVAGEKFSNYSQLTLIGGRDKRTESQNSRIALTIPQPLFDTNGIGSQESHAADAFWVVHKINDTSCRLYINAGNITYGFERIVGTL